ncbi:Hypothetical predicted protein, partial [Paramuricea clavata]
MARLPAAAIFTGLRTSFRVATQTVRKAARRTAEIAAQNPTVTKTGKALVVAGSSLAAGAGGQAIIEAVQDKDKDSLLQEQAGVIVNQTYLVGKIEAQRDEAMERFVEAADEIDQLQKEL